MQPKVPTARLGKGGHYMNTGPISPLETFDRLIEEAADKRRIRSLIALNEACKMLHNRNSIDFSYRSIVILGKANGLLVPGIKSIANSSGAHYRELISAWKLLRPQLPAKAAVDDWIDRIKDPALKMGVILLAKELRALKAKNARKASQNLIPVFEGSFQGRLLPTDVRLNTAELAALQASIDPLNLKFLGLRIGGRGEILDGKERQVFKPGFRSAIEKVLAIPLSGS